MTFIFRIPRQKWRENERVWWGDTLWRLIQAVCISLSASWIYFQCFRILSCCFPSRVSLSTQVDYNVTQKSFNFPKKHGLPFYFVSASDGTNVVKVSLHLYCLKCACVTAFATSYRICLWCCTSLRYFSFLLAWETKVGKSKSIVDTSDYKSVHEASRLCFLLTRL